MWKQDNILIINVFGIKNHFSKVELLELNVILKLLSLMQLKVIMTLWILLNKQFLYVHWKISLIKLNTQSNGQDNIFKVLLLNHLKIWKNSTKIKINFWIL